MPRRAINYEDLVYNLFDYFTKEKNNFGPLLDINKVQRRVCDALQIGDTTLQRILQRKKNPTTENKVPLKKLKPKSTDLCDIRKMDIRDMIYKMYAEKKHITLDSLLREVKERFVLDIGRTSLHETLKSIGFKFKMGDNRRGLCEQSHVVVQRTSFLRKYVDYLENNFKFVYLDETWIFRNGGCKRSWQDESFKSCKKLNASDGKRFIVLHAGNEDGFIPEAGLVFSSTSKSADYHDNMNNELFKKWVVDKLLPNLEEPSVIIMDNARYHSAIINKQPTSSWNKEEIMTWLKNENINFSPQMLKVELLNLAKQRKQVKRYVIDEIIESNGHQILRLPPYHCQFNPIEHIWGICKNYYDNNIGKNGYGDDKTFAMWEEALSKVTKEVWFKSVQHVNKLIKEWWTREQYLHNNCDSFIINLGDDSDSSSEEE